MNTSLSELLSQLPAEPDGSLLPIIRDRLADSGRKIVVLDDDPTGTQTVHDVPVLTRWSSEVLIEEFRRPGKLFYILTNSRALPPNEADALATEVGKNLLAASEAVGKDLTVISRSDSTLRGHYPIEVDALATAIGIPKAVHVIVPFFLQGGRYTIHDVHYVAEGDDLIPAGETAFAQDAAFGFQNSNLIDWVVEKRGGDLTRDQVHSVGLADLRVGDPNALTEQIKNIPEGHVCIVNAVTMRDMQSFVQAAMMAESAGSKFVYRTAASFVQAFAGLAPKPLLTAAEMVNVEARAGLVVVGSYVPKTTAQLTQLLDRADGIEAVVLNVDQLLCSAADAHVDEAIRCANQAIAEGRNVVVHTSRRLVTGGDAATSLRIGNQVSDAVVRVVRGIDQPLRFLIAKGGITSSDVATKAMDVQRATVLGQILPGIPVWRLGDDSRMPGLAYVVFPGNVGDADALLTAYQKLN